MPRRTPVRLLGAAVALLAPFGLLGTTTAPAAAGQVGVTVQIQGAGEVIVVEGSLEDGTAAHCNRFTNIDHRVTVSCPRIRNEEPFEAWVWLRPTPSPAPAGEWVFDGWEGCDQTRQTNGTTECAVHSGAFNTVERSPLARFRDVVAPTVALGPASQVPARDRAFRFDFSATGGATQCRVVGVSDFSGCTSPHKAVLPEGPRRFEVRASDASGNSTTQGVDVVSVDTRIVDGPDVASNIAAPRFELASSGGEQFLCSMDGAAYRLCGDGPTAGVVFPTLADGNHVLRVHARAGAWTDLVPAEYRWSIDTVAPVTTLDPPQTTADSATFSFTAPGETFFSCRLTTPTQVRDWTWCQSPMTYQGLAQGEHLFEVRGTDIARNWEATARTHRWTVDTVAPVTRLASVSTSFDSAAITFAAPGAARSECRLSGPGRTGSWTTCASPVAYASLTPGEHVFEVRSIDAAGNVEATPVSHRWTATARPVPDTQPDPQPSPGVPDTTAPETSLSGGPSGFTLASSATFGVVTEPGASVSCTLDGVTVPCSTSVSVARLGSGTHTLTAAAVDQHGNVDPTPAVRTWTVPLTARELKRTKAWKLRSSSGSHDGSQLVAAQRGAALTRPVSGARAVALVVGKGRGHGTVRVYAGKRLVGTVSLTSKRTRSGLLVPVTSFATPFTGDLRIVVKTAGRQVRIEGLGVASG